MLKRLLKSRMFAALVGATVVAAIGGGIGWAAIPDSTGVIHGCYAKSNGALRAIDRRASSPAARPSLSTAGNRAR